MLCLTRKTGEKLTIGTDREIEIVVLEISGNKVRLGVVAPRDVAIWRNELLPLRSDAEQRELGGESEGA